MEKNISRKCAKSSNSYYTSLWIRGLFIVPNELILKGIQKYPIIIYMGAALFAWTVGEMMLKESLFHTSKVTELLFLNGISLAILLVGRNNSITLLIFNNTYYWYVYCFCYFIKHGMRWICCHYHKFWTSHLLRMNTFYWIYSSYLLSFSKPVKYWK